MIVKTSFDPYLRQAWSEHSLKIFPVSDSLPSGVQMIESNAQIEPLADLIIHVMGEHLGLWDQGVQMLESLRKTKGYQKISEGENAILRSIAILEYAAGKRGSITEFSTSDQIRILAVAASAMNGQRNPERASAAFSLALGKAQNNLSRSDPAIRVLAIAGNNLAAALEEKPERKFKESEFMVLAAQVGRKFWKIAGSWKDLVFAEYRLARSYLKFGDLTKSLEHAQMCIEICAIHSANPVEYFFGYECLAHVEKARGNQLGFTRAFDKAITQFKKLPASEKTWCEKRLKILK